MCSRGPDPRPAAVPRKQRREGRRRPPCRGGSPSAAPPSGRTPGPAGGGQAPQPLRRGEGRAGPPGTHLATAGAREVLPAAPRRAAPLLRQPLPPPPPPPPRPGRLLLALERHHRTRPPPPMRDSPPRLRTTRRKEGRGAGPAASRGMQSGRGRLLGGPRRRTRRPAVRPGWGKEGCGRARRREPALIGRGKRVTFARAFVLRWRGPAPAWGGWWPSVAGEGRGAAAPQGRPGLSALPALPLGVAGGSPVTPLPLGPERAVERDPLLRKAVSRQTPGHAALPAGVTERGPRGAARGGSSEPSRLRETL